LFWCSLAQIQVHISKRGEKNSSRSLLESSSAYQNLLTELNKDAFSHDKGEHPPDFFRDSGHCAMFANLNDWSVKAIDLE
jgi:hypothetical protein